MLTAKTGQSEAQGVQASSLHQSVHTPRSPALATPRPTNYRAHLQQLLNSSTSAILRDLPTPSPLSQRPLLAMETTPLPPHPQPYQGDEQMRHWLRAKIEEDRRRQEEQRTRQEVLSLEQRKLEQSMLADSLRAGVPSQLIPLIFVSINKDGTSQVAIEIAQQLLMQQKQALSQQQQTTPRSGPPNTVPMPSMSQSQQQQKPSEPQTNSRVMSSRTSAAQWTRTAAPVSERNLPQPAPMRNGSPKPGHGPSNPRSTRPAEPGAPRAPDLDAMFTLAQAAVTNLGSIQAESAETRPPASPQSAQSQQNARPQPSPTSLYWYHCVPVSQSSFNKPQEFVLPSNASVSPTRKRKSQSAHQQMAPPAFRPVDSAAQTPWSSRPHSPSGHQRNDGPGSRESRTATRHTSEQSRQPKSTISYLLRPHVPSDSAKDTDTEGRTGTKKKETDRRTAGQETQIEQPQRKPRSRTRASVDTSPSSKSGDGP